MFVTGRSEGVSTGLDFATVAYDAGSGAKVWVKRYNGPPGTGNDYASAISVSPDGSRVFVTGTSQGISTDQDYATVAYDASTGAQLWVKRYNGWNRSDQATAIRVSPDGSKVFVTGRSQGVSSGGDSSDRDYATVAYDADSGAQLWATRFNWSGSGDDLAEALSVSPDGLKVFVTGSSQGVLTGDDFATLAYDASSGTKLWLTRFNGSGLADAARAISVSPDGSKVFVTGFSQSSSSGQDYATVAYNGSSGAQLWLKRYNAPANLNDFANAVGVSPDGSKVFVTGESDGGASSFDYATLAYDAGSGTQVWLKRFNWSGSGSEDAIALGVSPDGSKVFVTGTSQGVSTGNDYATLAYDTGGGTQLWVHRYSGTVMGSSGFDEADGIAVSGDGLRVFITGQSAGASSGPDYATVAYTP